MAGSVQNTSGGSTASLIHTPQAQDDNFTGTVTGLTEDFASFVYLAVMADDLGGNVKSLWSIDNGTNNSSVMNGFVAGDLLTQDTARFEAASTDTSLHGAKIWITAGGQIGYDAATLDAAFRAQLQALAQGQDLIDTFI